MRNIAPWSILVYFYFACKCMIIYLIYMLTYNKYIARGAMFSIVYFRKNDIPELSTLKSISAKLYPNRFGENGEPYFCKHMCFLAFILWCLIHPSQQRWAYIHFFMNMDKPCWSIVSKWKKAPSVCVEGIIKLLKCQR